MIQFLFCFFAILTYVGIGPVRFPSQVQPWAALIGWGGFFLAASTGHRVRIARTAWILIALSIVFMFYFPQFPPINLDILPHLKKSVVFFFSIGILLYAQFITLATLRIATVICGAIYALAALIQVAVPPLYSIISGILVPDKNLYADLKARGATSLTPEATDFGFTAVFLLLFAFMTAERRDDGRISPTSWLAGALALSCILLSQSGSGVIGGIVVLLLVALSRADYRRHLAKIAIVGTSAVVLGVMLIPMERLLEIRGFNLLYTLCVSPSDLLQTSFAHRYMQNFVGILGFVKSNGLGYGAGTFTEKASTIYMQEGLFGNPNLTEFHKLNIAETMDSQVSGTIPMLLFEYGILGLSMIVVLVFRMASSSIRYRLACTALLSMTLLQSFPPAYPLLWLLLGMADNPHFCLSPSASPEEGET